MRGLTDPFRQTNGPAAARLFWRMRGRLARGRRRSKSSCPVLALSGGQRKLRPRALYPAPRENPDKVLRESKAVVSRAGTLRCSTDFLPNVSIV